MKGSGIKPQPHISMPKALDDLLCRKSGSAVVTKRWHTKWPTAQRTKNRSKNARIDAEFLGEAPVNESKVVELKRKRVNLGLGGKPRASKMRDQHASLTALRL